MQTTSLDLASVAIVRCDSDDRLRQASAVAMGRAPWAKEQIVVDRTTILSCLAAAGFDAKKIQFTGSEKVVVRRDEKIIPGEQVLQAAEGFLQESRPGPAGCSWKLAKKVEELIVPAAKDTKVQARLVRGEGVSPLRPAGILPASGTTSNSAERQAPPAEQGSADRAANAKDDGLIVLEVFATSGKTELGKTTAVFQVLYPCQQAVAIKDIAANAALTQENIRVEAGASEIKSDEPWVAPFGMVAARAIRAGAVLGAGMVRPPRPEILVKRGQTVPMRIQGLGFVVSAVGEAQEDGHGGDFIKVRNVDTRRIVVAKVAFDGTVEPMVNEAGK